MAKMLPNAGPWTYECGYGGAVIKDADGKAVAQARPRRDGWNAELLAAAPDLLEALIELHAWAIHDSGAAYPEGTFEIVQTAISKAQGVRP